MSTGGGRKSQYGLDGVTNIKNRWSFDCSFVANILISWPPLVDACRIGPARGLRKARHRNSWRRPPGLCWSGPKVYSLLLLPLLSEPRPTAPKSQSRTWSFATFPSLSRLFVRAFTRDKRYSPGLRSTAWWPSLSFGWCWKYLISTWTDVTEKSQGCKTRLGNWERERPSLRAMENRFCISGMEAAVSNPYMHQALSLIQGRVYLPFFPSPSNTLV